jgi:hypothetical protein
MVFVQRLRGELTDAPDPVKRPAWHVAAAALSYFLKIKANECYMEVLRGAILAELFQAGLTSDAIQSQREAFDNVLRDCAEHSNAAKTTFTTVESRFQDGFRELKELRERQQSDFLAAEQKRKEQHDQVIAAYGEHTRLKAPVKYWSDKRSHHGWRRLGYGIVLVIWGCAAVAAFAGVWHFGYLNAISSLTAQASATQTPSVSADAAPGGASPEPVDISNIENIAAFAHYLGLLAFVLVALIWVTRLLVRMWLTHLHLESEAHERVVMAETFVALVGDGKVTEKDDRQLVLQALFRHVGDGLVKDDALPELLSAINRAVTAKG